MLHVDEALRSRMPGVIFGVVTLRNVTVRAHDEQLWSEIEALGRQLADKYTLDGLSEYSHIAVVRGMQKALASIPCATVLRQRRCCGVC